MTFLFYVLLLYIISLGDDLSIYIKNRIISHLKVQAYVAKIIGRVLADKNLPSRNGRQYCESGKKDAVKDLWRLIKLSIVHKSIETGELFAFIAFIFTFGRTSSANITILFVIVSFSLLISL